MIPNPPSLEMELAALYQRQGDVKQALAHAEKSLRLDPKQQEAYFLLASLHVGLNQLAEATREYERILTLDPENREARLFLATLYAQQKQYPKAIRTVQELLRLDPQLVVAYYYLGRIYLETDRLPEAKKEFLRVLTMDPKFVPAMFDLGVTLERERQYNRALSMYRRILRAHPRNSKVWTSIGRLYLIMNRYGDAQKAFRKVKDLERNDPAADFNIALICLEQKLPDDAIRLFRPLLTLPRYQERARYFIAMALEEKGDLKAAALEYQLVGRDSENFIQARLRMAYLTFQMGDKERARQILTELLTQAPQQEEIYLTNSYFYEEDNQWDLAIQALKAGLGKVERPQEIHFRLAVLYEKQNNRSESIQEIKKVLELDPNNADAQNFLGYSYAEAGTNLDEAEKLIREALRTKPDSGHIIDSLGWVYYKKGQYDKAVAELERAHRIMPQDGTVAEHLGDAYFKMKRYRDALRTYRRALALENANTPALRKKITQAETLLKEVTPLKLRHFFWLAAGGPPLVGRLPGPAAGPAAGGGNFPGRAARPASRPASAGPILPGQRPHHLPVPQQNYSGTALLTGRLPASLKVDVLDFLGRTILSFATDGVEVKVLSPRENKLFQGPATPRNLAAFIPPTVSLPQALRLLVGALPLSQGPPQHSEYEAATGRYRLEWRQGDALTERLWVAAQGLYPVQEEWFGGAPEPRFTAELANFGALAPDLPEKITLKTTTPKMELRLVYRDLKLNPTLTAAELTLRPLPAWSRSPWRNSYQLLAISFQ